MGMHRWLLGPLICLILATTSARPPECQLAPSWSVNGTQPLVESQGKASMLEALLKHFRSYGMNDLEFIIVNSKLSHSQDKLHELQRRVSFTVYQETEEQEIWSVMEGGKDDMFVYDRCGRLTYFVPFPLSILNESPLVSNAILATYFRSPCGVTCDENDTLEIEDFVKNLENEPENITATSVTEVTEEYNATEEFITEIEVNQPEQSNDVLHILASHNKQVDNVNSTDSTNTTDYEHPVTNSTVNSNETNSANINEVSSYFNELYRLFFNTKSERQPEENTTNSFTINETLATEATLEFNNTSDTPHESFPPREHNHNHNSSRHQKPKKKSDRCAEADFEVCKSWSKKRLLHAQKCCSLGSETPVTVGDYRSCDTFGKRRCKKIQSILKCCIKTLYTETLTTTSLPVQTTETSQFVDAVCCKTTDSGKFCRVSETGACDEGEVLEGSSQSTNCESLP